VPLTFYKLNLYVMNAVGVYQWMILWECRCMGVCVGLLKRVRLSVYLCIINVDNLFDIFYVNESIFL
jgi:hypothetical protein